MKGKKERLAGLLAPNGKLRWPTNWLSSWQGTKQLLVLAYHRICDYNEDYPFDLELVSATPKQFDWQVGWLKQHVDLITFADLAAINSNQKAMPKRPAIITFDDGFDDNFLQAFPILKQHNAVATFFVSTDYVGTDRLFWYEWFTYLIMRPTAERFEVKALGISEALPETSAARRPLVAHYLDVLKRADPDRQQATLEELESRQQEASDRQDWHLSRAMSWQQVREMSDAGMEIGSHGAAHMMLAKLDDQRLDDELMRSKQTIEQHTGTPVCSIAYPVGKPDACDERVFGRAADCGYQYGCVYQDGRNPRSSQANLALYRPAIERYVGREMFACRASFPALF